MNLMNLRGLLKKHKKKSKIQTNIGSNKLNKVMTIALQRKKPLKMDFKHVFKREALWRN